MVSKSRKSRVVAVPSVSDGGVQNIGLERETKILSVNENLNRTYNLNMEIGELKTKKQNNNSLKAVSKTSEMLDIIQHFSAQALSRMSKITKLYFIKKFLNRSSEMLKKRYCTRGVQNVHNGRMGKNMGAMGPIGLMGPMGRGCQQEYEKNGKGSLPRLREA